MQLRQVILKALLGSLALAAVAGVIAALTASHVIARVTGTGVATGVAALLMLPLTGMVDRVRLRAASLCGVCTVAAAFMLVLMMMWDVERILPGSVDEDEILSTVGIVLLAGVAGMTFLLMLGGPTSRLAGMVGLATNGVFVLLALVALWLPGLGGGMRWGQTRWDLFGTAWTIAGFGVLVTVALIGWGPGDRRHWRWAGVGASVIGAVIAIGHIWGGGGGREWIFALFMIAAMYVAWANVIVSVPLKAGQRTLRIATLGFGTATAVLSEVLVVEFVEPIARLDAATAILAACGTLALAVVAIMNRRVRFETVSRAFDSIVVICPACRKKQAIAMGGAACRTCGLRIEVQASEPRCPECDYLLFRLSSERCPECGTAVRHAGTQTAA